MRTRMIAAAMACAATAALTCPAVRAGVTVQAYYRLGDADPGAAAGNVGDDPTVDSIGSMDLTRHGSPHYSDDVPLLPTATGDQLSMRFLNDPRIVNPVGVPAQFYGRLAVVMPPSVNYGMEAWVKAATDSSLDPSGYSLIAYDGSPFVTPTATVPNGMGFFQKGSNYVVRIGTAEKVLAPVVAGRWQHLVFLRKQVSPTAAANDFFADDVEAPDLTSAAQTLPLFPTESLKIGGRPDVVPGGSELFNGWIDEVRFFTFTTTGPGAFDPQSDLLVAVPEPGAGMFMAAVAPLLVRRRR